MHRFNTELAKTSYVESGTVRSCFQFEQKNETKNILSTSLKPLHKDTSL